MPTPPPPQRGPRFPAPAILRKRKSLLNLFSPGRRKYDFQIIPGQFPVFRYGGILPGTRPELQFIFLSNSNNSRSGNIKTFFSRLINCFLFFLFYFFGFSLPNLNHVVPVQQQVYNSKPLILWEISLFSLTPAFLPVSRHPDSLHECTLMGPDLHCSSVFSPD